METVKVGVNVSRENECTAYPWWVIIDPKQNFHTNDKGVHRVANMITGPFFSRDTAQQHLECRRHAFSSNAHVFCMSGYWSSEYSNAIDNAGGV